MGLWKLLEMPENFISARPWCGHERLDFILKKNSRVTAGLLKRKSDKKCRYVNLHRRAWRNAWNELKIESVVDNSNCNILSNFQGASWSRYWIGSEKRYVNPDVGTSICIATLQQTLRTSWKSQGTMALMCSNSDPKIRLLARFVIANTIDCSRKGKEEKSTKSKTSRWWFFQV